MRRIVSSVLGMVVAVAVAMPASAAFPLLQDKEGYPTLAPLVEQVTPAVVNISVVSRAPAQQNPLLQDPFFRRFFGGELPEAQPRLAAGSGVIVDAAQGYVLTNNHVVANGSEIMVTLKDQRRFKAKLVGADPGTDIALLRIEAPNLIGLSFGDSSALNVGDGVVAVGNPFGLGQTVTSGIVSALGRSGLNVEGYEDFIQTDASINPGNSGGALVNLKGQLVGINTAIIGPTGGNVGIGFAVPSGMAKAVMEQLIRYGEVRRGRLGVSVQDLTPDLAQALGIDQSQGAVVTQVEPGSPADKGGIHAGDVVIAVNGGPLHGSADLRNRVGLTPVGQEVRLTVLRDSKPREFTLRVGKAETTTAEMGKAVPQLAGATVRTTEKGVVVADVEPDSPAFRIGLRQGDIILSVNRRRIATAEEFQAAVGQSRTLALHIDRKGANLFIVIQ